jgi:hypothetical protein
MNHMAGRYSVIDCRVHHTQMLLTLNICLASPFGKYRQPMCRDALVKVYYYLNIGIPKKEEDRVSTKYSYGRQASIIGRIVIMLDRLLRK